MDGQQSEDELNQINEVFFPHSTAKFREVRERGTRFVHYTRAEAAISIIRNKEVWLRKSTTMNDFMEIEHGIECLQKAYHEASGEKLRKTLEDISPGVTEKFHKLFDAWLPQFRDQTYLMCLSEHDESEDRLGRLSMWRGYGASVGVALVLKNTPFVSESDALNVYTSPVRYTDADGFSRDIFALSDAILREKNLLEGLDQDRLIDYLFMAFRFSILCTKHPGFSEEREWRLIHNPTLDQNARVKKCVEVIGGVPQPVMKVALKDYESEGFIGSEIPLLVDRIIIGPTHYPDALREAFQHELEIAGVDNFGK